MPKLSDTQVPSYRRHKQSGQAIVTLSGRDILLGKYNTRQSRDLYNRKVAEWLAAGRQLPVEPTEITISEIVVAFRKHAASYYRFADGTPTNEVCAFDTALRPLSKLYARTPTAEFGPLKLKAVRNEMIALGWCRASVNQHIGRVRRVFKWAAENELIPASVYHGLQAVSGLRAGRSDAPETEPVKPVPVDYVDAVLPYLSSQVAAMIRLQLLTGARPGEICAMRGCDIDTTGKLWVYRPQHHKTQHHGHAREIYLGPRAQEVVRPFLKPDLTAHLFSPAEAATERLQRRHERRRTPIGQGNGPGTNRKRRLQRRPQERYSVDSYRRAIARACDKADAWAKGGVVIGNDERIVPRWHPHQLRHTAATNLRKTFGLEAAGVILGHKTLAVTELYAEKNVAQAMRIAAEVG